MPFHLVDVRFFCAWRSWVMLAAMLVLLPPLVGCGGKKKESGLQTRPPLNKGAKKKSSKASKATQRPYVIKGITYCPIPSAVGYKEKGLASWYGEPFHGRKTSNGEIYDMYADTAAHKTLPMDTMLLVKNMENGRSTVVRINDRGPFVRERIIDLSYAKAKNLGIVGQGTARVEIIALEAMRSSAPDKKPPQAVAQASTPPKPSPPRKNKTPAAAKQPALSKPLAANASEPQCLPSSSSQAKKSIPDFDKGNFYVQVGVFERLEEARPLAKDFAQKGRDVIIQQYPAAGMNLYRVLVFASHSLKEGKAYEQRMRQAGYRYALLLAR